MKVLRGSVIMDPSMIRFLDDQEVAGILASLVRASLEGLLRVSIAVAPFNANITYRGSSVYRVSISYGALIITPPPARGAIESLGDVVSTVCYKEDLDDRLCWYLNEDVWADARILVPSVSLNKSHRCPEEYKESIARLGLDIADESRSKILCLSSGDSVTIDEPEANHLIIPTDESNSYKEHIIDHAGGYRHPLEALLIGRRVACSEHRDLDLPGESRVIVRSINRDPLLYTIYDRIYILGCKPPPEDLLFKLSAIYTATHPESSRQSPTNIP